MNVIIDRGTSARSAFIICDETWQESQCAVGRDVLNWGPVCAWIEGAHKWAFEQESDIYAGEFYSIREAAESRGHNAPHYLSALAQHVGVSGDLTTPEGRCRIMASIMRRLDGQP